MIKELLIFIGVSISMLVIISIETILLSKITDVQHSIKKKDTKQISQEFISYSKENSIWCLNNCIRHISRKYGTVKEYDNCRNICKQTYNQKKLIF